MRILRSHQLGPAGQTNFYHVVSRTAGKLILFNDADKEAFVEIMRRQLAFCGLRALSWCMMGNHFHLLLEVPGKEAEMARLSDEDCFKRLKFLEDEFSTRCLEAEISICRENRDSLSLSRIADQIRERIFDLSAFMKELKLKMTGWYNYRHRRTGTLWEGRFRSLIVQDGRALQLVAAYIDLNPLRAKIVSDPLNYRWCSYANAVAGSEEAQRGIARSLSIAAEDGSNRRIPWGVVIAQYRMLLYGVGTEKSEQGGFTPEGIRRVIGEKGHLPSFVALRVRMRFLTYGLALGSQSFVDEYFRSRQRELGHRRSVESVLPSREFDGLRSICT
jgi:putative transposase